MAAASLGASGGRPAIDDWWAYVLVSRGGRTYVGVTCDVERRLAQHNGALPGGAKSTRAGRPWRVDAQFGPFAGRGAALSAEYRLKRLSGPERIELGRRARLARDTDVAEPIPKAHPPLFDAALPGDLRAETFEMFGGVAIRVGGHLAGGLLADTVVVRLSPVDWARAVKAGGRPFVPMERLFAMQDMILLPKGTLDNRVKTERWLQRAIDFTATLPKVR